MNENKPNAKLKKRSGDINRFLLIGLTSFLVLCSVAIFVPGPIQKTSFMGAPYCGACHRDEYQSWANSAHARATDRLPSDKNSDQTCLACHATGIFEPNQPYLKGVQCESCHGPGEHYASLHIKRDPVLAKLLFMQRPAADSCKHCHSAHAGLWSINHGMKKIDHWSIVPASRFHGDGKELIKSIVPSSELQN